MNLIKDFKDTVLIFVFPACHKILGTEQVLKKYLTNFIASHFFLLTGIKMYLIGITLLILYHNSSSRKSPDSKTEAK